MPSRWSRGLGCRPRASPPRPTGGSASSRSTLHDRTTVAALCRIGIVRCVSLQVRAGALADADLRDQLAARPARVATAIVRATPALRPHGAKTKSCPIGRTGAAAPRMKAPSIMAAALVLGRQRSGKRQACRRRRGRKAWPPRRAEELVCHASLIRAVAAAVARMAPAAQWTSVGNFCYTST